MTPGYRELRGCAIAACIAFVTGGAVARDGAGRGPADLYLRVCSACHGEKGNGQSLASGALKTAPRDFTTEAARTGLSREYMIAIVRDGRPHTAMAGRASRLPQDEVEAVVDFIRAAFLPPEPGTELALGRALYRRSCASCHGDRGQGGAARGAIPSSPPVSAARARPGLTAEAIAGAILREPHAPGIPASTSGFAEPEARAIAAYIRSAFIEAAAGARKAQ
ncbi:MAG: c-type cytochrome [Betaproteobacteria bacterium]|nr:c-type cytochrome [Betaproteobacteria bacterium]